MKYIAIVAVPLLAVLLLSSCHRDDRAQFASGYLAGYEDGLRESFRRSFEAGKIIGRIEERLKDAPAATGSPDAEEAGD